MEKFFNTRSGRISYLMGVKYPHFLKLNADTVCHCDREMKGCDLINTDTGEVMETLFICAECSRKEKEKAEKKAREERIKNYIFRPEIQSKIDRKKRIPKYDLAYMIEQIEGVNSCYTLFVDVSSRERLVKKFNEIFGTDIP